jgi:hypothetical protein
MIFFSMNILTNLRRFHLQFDNLKTLIFVKNKLLNDPRIGCKPPSNLVELIEKDFDLGEELKKLNIHLNEMKL